MIKCLFPNFIAFSLDFYNSLSLHLKKIAHGANWHFCKSRLLCNYTYYQAFNKITLCLNKSLFGWFHFCYPLWLVLDLLLILRIAKLDGLKPHNSLKTIAATLKDTCKHRYILLKDSIIKLLTKLLLVSTGSIKSDAQSPVTK